MPSPEWVHIKTDLLEKMLSASHITGEEARIIVAYYVSAGNIRNILDLLKENSQDYLIDKIKSLSKRGYIV